jgi:hypothetical protein
LSIGHATKTLLDGRQIKLTTSSVIISLLKPILRLDSGNNGVVRLLHKSVFDYLTTRAKEPIWVNVPAQDGILAMQCLDIMNRNLKYDICNIGNTSLLNSEVEGLPALVSKYIPEALHYASLFFVHHLKDAPTSQPALAKELHKFITCNLLHWMEVMSLLNQVHQAEVCLQILSDCLQVNLFPLSH